MSEPAAVPLPDGGAVPAAVAEPGAVRPTATGTGWRVLVLPAMGTPAGYYARLVDGLAERGLAAAAVGWRGLGAGTPPAGRRADWDYGQLLGADLPAARAWVEQRWPERRTLVLGHSLGGQLALMDVALRPGPAVATVAAGSPHWRHHGRRGAGIFGVAAGMVAISSLVGHWPGGLLKFAGRESRGVVKDWAAHVTTGRPRPRGLTGLAAAMAVAEPDVLAIDVAGDRLAPASSVDGLTRMLPRARVTRWHLDDGTAGRGADHFRWARDAVDPVADRLTAWLAGL